MHSEATMLPNRRVFQTVGTRKYLSVCVIFRFFYLSIPFDHLYKGLPVLHQTHYWKPDHKHHQLISNEVSPWFLALSRWSLVPKQENTQLWCFPGTSLVSRRASRHGVSIAS